MTICSVLQSWVKEFWEYLSTKCCFLESRVGDKQQTRNNTELKHFMALSKKTRSTAVDSLAVWSPNEKTAFWDIIEEHVSHLLTNARSRKHDIPISPDLISFGEIEPLDLDDFEKCRQLTGKELWDGHYVTAVQIYLKMSRIFAETFLFDLNASPTIDFKEELKKDLSELKKIFLESENL